MKRGFLSDYFVGVAMKRLSAVEVDIARSHQREFNGSHQLKSLFGNSEPQEFRARFIWFGEENEGLTSDGSLTWYDARRAHPTRSEYRLYFQPNEASRMARAGDAIFFAKRPDDSVLVIITDPSGTIYSQLVWLFGLADQPSMEFEVRDLETAVPTEIDFAARFILDELGVEMEEPEADLLDGILEKFGPVFPGTADFSAFARKSLTDVFARDAPDEALLAWMEREEILFRRLERHMVSKRIEQGFTGDEGADIEGFLSFSLTVQNRRKSRVGHALENHLQAVFEACEITFARGALTENRSKPDFLFPGAREYHDPEFLTRNLTMLGAKSSCKDRWRQVLSEAARIQIKHLFTLEPGISSAQTDEMRSKDLQLVLPERLHATFRPEQADWLMSLSEFIQLVRTRQTES
jgi:hypothetical protein